MYLIGCLLLAGGCARIDYGKASSPGAVTGVDHILLSVSDLDRSAHFYRDVLGMVEQQRFKHFVMLKAGSFGVILSTQPWEFEKKGEPKGVGQIPHFTTPDMGAFEARLKASGVPWLRGPKKELFGTEAFFVDPDGYQWAVLAP
jgi:catechol 2,3-dioxygenase-like lactoylglutathione lyase family enzyme